MEEIEQITDSIIDNLLLKNIKSSIKNNGGVMGIIQSNIKIWDKKLKTACDFNDVNYLDMVNHILELKGYVIDRETLTTYMHRARKPSARRKCKKVAS